MARTWANTEELALNKWFISVWPSNDYDYETDGTADDVQINAALLEWNNVYIAPWNYDITSKISTWANRVLVLEAWVTLTRNASMNTDDDNIVDLDGDSSMLTWYWAIIDNNSVALDDTASDAHGIKISANKCTVKWVRVINTGTDFDSAIWIIGESWANIYYNKVIDCVVEATTNIHFFQSKYAERGTSFINCTAIGDSSSTVQDWFRTYESSDVTFINCYAYGTRVWFQSWDTGNRNITFTDCKAEACEQHWFQIAGAYTSVMWGWSYNNWGRGINIEWDGAQVVWLYCRTNACTSTYCVTENTADWWTLTTANGGEVRVKWGKAYVRVNGEANASGATWYWAVVVWDNNDIKVPLNNSWFRTIYVYSWADYNVIYKAIASTSQVVTDNWSNNQIIDETDYAILANSNTFTWQIQSVQNASNPRFKVDTGLYIMELAIATSNNQFVTWTALADGILKVTTWDLFLATSGTSRFIHFYVNVWWICASFDTNWKMIFNNANIWNITPQSTAPSSPATNDIYLDDGTNTTSTNPWFRQWNGSSWDDLTA